MIFFYTITKVKTYCISSLSSTTDCGTQVWKCTHVWLCVCVSGCILLLGWGDKLEVKLCILKADIDFLRSLPKFLHGCLTVTSLLHHAQILQHESRTDGTFLLPAFQWSLTPLWVCYMYFKCTAFISKTRGLNISALLHTVSCWARCHGPPGRSRCRGRHEHTATHSRPGAWCPAHAPPHHSARSESSCLIGWRCWGWPVCRRSRQKLAHPPPHPSEADGRLERTHHWIYIKCTLNADYIRVQ